MNLQELMDAYHEEGLTRELAAARVCQDIVLKAIAEGPLSRNVTIKGGVDTMQQYTYPPLLSLSIRIIMEKASRLKLSMNMETP